MVRPSITPLQGRQIIVKPSNDVALAVLRAEAPQLSVQSFSLLSQGRQKWVYDVNQTHVLRFAQSKAGLASMDRELGLLAYIARSLTSYLPTPILVGRLAAIDVCTRLPGDALTSDFFRTLSHEKRQKLGQGIGWFLAHLHQSMDSITAVARGALQHPSWSFPAEQLRKTFVPLLSSDYQRTSAQSLIDECVVYEAMQTDTVLLHDDFHGANILHDSNSGALCGVCDFEFSIGDRHRDFRYLIWSGPEFAGTALREYSECTGLKLSLSRVLSYHAASEMTELEYQHRVVGLRDGQFIASRFEALQGRLALFSRALPGLLD